MEKETVELYSDADLARLRGRIKGWKVGLALTAAAGIAVCAALAALTRTANASVMELSAIAVSTVTGWVVLYFAIYRLTPYRRELGHAEMLRSAKRERVAGQVTVTAERLIIVKSIAVRRVEVRDGEKLRGLLVIDTRAGALEKAVASAVWVANGYVAAFEVEK